MSGFFIAIIYSRAKSTLIAVKVIKSFIQTSSLFVTFCNRVALQYVFNYESRLILVISS